METLDQIKNIITLDYEKKVNQWDHKTWSCDVLLVGDSIVAYYTPSIKICIQGIAGDTSKGVLNRIETIKRAHPKHVFIHVGTNDIILESMTITETMNHLKQIQQQLKPLQVVFLTPLPVIESNLSIQNILRTQQHLQSLSNEISLVFKENALDIFNIFMRVNTINTLYKEDGLHLNTLGYTIYEQTLFDFMKEHRI